MKPTDRYRHFLTKNSNVLLKILKFSKFLSPEGLKTIKFYEKKYLDHKLKILTSLALQN